MKKGSLIMAVVLLMASVSQALAWNDGYNGRYYNGRYYDGGHQRKWNGNHHQERRHHNSSDDLVVLGAVLGGIILYDALTQPQPGYGGGYPQPMTCYSEVCGQWDYDPYGNRYCRYQRQVQVQCR